MSWAQLQAILDEARAEHEENEQDEPSACPNDGEPLTRTDSGNLVCLYDGWVWR